MAFILANPTATPAAATTRPPIEARATVMATSGSASFAGWRLIAQAGSGSGFDWFRDLGRRYRTYDRQLRQPRWRLWNTLGVQREQQWVDGNKRIGQRLPRRGNDGFPQRFGERQSDAWNDRPQDRFFIRLFVGQLTARWWFQRRPTDDFPAAAQERHNSDINDWRGAVQRRRVNALNGGAR